MSEIKLLPCPFCGGEAEIEKSYDGLDERWKVMCPKCFCKTTTFATKKSAVITWNTRKPMERIIERLEENSKFLLYEMGDSKMYAGNESAIAIVKEEGGIE